MDLPRWSYEAEDELELLGLQRSLADAGVHSQIRRMGSGYVLESEQVEEATKLQQAWQRSIAMELHLEESRTLQRRQLWQDRGLMGLAGLIAVVWLVLALFA